MRYSQQVRKPRDQWLEKVRERYARKGGWLQDQFLHARDRLEREQTQYRQQTMHTAISYGTALRRASLSRKAVTRATLGHTGTAARAFRAPRGEKEDIQRASEAVERIQEKIEALDVKLRSALEETGAWFEKKDRALQTETLRARRRSIFVGTLPSGWPPFRQDEPGACNRSGPETPPATGIPRNQYTGICGRRRGNWR